MDLNVLYEEVKNKIEMIKDELSGAKEYAILYSEYKEFEPQMSKIYIEMSKDEIRHAMYIHDDLMSKLVEWKELEEIPKFILDMVSNLHEEYVSCIAKTKYMFDL